MHAETPTAVMRSLIMAAKRNDIDPQAWLADALARIAEAPQTQLAELPPWNWSCGRMKVAA